MWWGEKKESFKLDCLEFLEMKIKIFGKKVLWSKIDSNDNIIGG